MRKTCHICHGIETNKRRITFSDVLVSLKIYSRLFNPAVIWNAASWSWMNYNATGRYELHKIPQYRQNTCAHQVVPPKTLFLRMRRLDLPKKRTDWPWSNQSISCRLFLLGNVRHVSNAYVQNHRQRAPQLAGRNEQVTCLGLVLFIHAR